MNEYFNALTNDLGVTNGNANDWSKMLMSLANQNNSWSAEQAQKQMDFQREMSNTAHQREVADLKAAGLNPVLSAKLGGASTPSGAAATADTAVVGSMVQLMDKMLDVEQSNAKLAAMQTAGSGSGSIGNSGTDAFGHGLVSWLADQVPGVNSKQADKIATAVMESGGDGFFNWLITGNTSSGEKNNYQTPKSVLQGVSPHSKTTHQANGGR